MNAERQKPIDFAVERLCIALSTDRNCGIRAESVGALLGSKSHEKAK
jgi:hypothetical protein